MFIQVVIIKSGLLKPTEHHVNTTATTNDSRSPTSPIMPAGSPSFVRNLFFFSLIMFNYNTTSKTLRNFFFLIMVIY